MPIYLDDLPPYLREQLQGLPLKVNAFRSADRVWQELSAAERAKLVDVARKGKYRAGESKPKGPRADLHLCYDRLDRTTGMWMTLHGYDRETAVIDLGYRLNFLSRPDHEWLMGLLGASVTPPPAKPRWDSERRKLWLGDRLVREVRSNRADAIITVLEEFEAEGWPADIQAPPVKQPLGELVRSLNHGADGIRFHGRKGHIWWEPS